MATKKNQPLMPYTSSFDHTVKPTTPQYQGSEDFYSPYETVRSRVEQWFIRPLREMNDRDYGFIMLIAVIPLYEKHLRFLKPTCFKQKKHPKKDVNLSQSNKIFEVIGKDLDLTPDEAFYFWGVFRNGLLHRAVPALPDKLKFIKWVMAPTGRPVVFENNTLTVDPIALKERLLDIIEHSRKMWENDIAGFPLIHKNL